MERTGQMKTQFPRGRFCLVMGIALFLPVVWIVQLGMSASDDRPTRAKTADEQYELGKKALAVKDYDLAIELLNRAIAEYGQLARECTERGEVDANRFWRQSWQRWPTQHRKSLHSSVSEWVDAVLYRNKQATAYLKRGQAYQAKGEHAQAVADFTEAIDRNSQLLSA